MTHRFNYDFDSPDEGCNVFCVIEYEVEAPEHRQAGHHTYTLDGQIDLINVRALHITGYDLDGNKVYDLLPDELSDGWAEALNLIADANVRQALDDDDGCLCLGECLWENAGFCS
jgi:hypothetical protein